MEKKNTFPGSLGIDLVLVLLSAFHGRIIEMTGRIKVKVALWDALFQLTGLLFGPVTQSYDLFFRQPNKQFEEGKLG